MKKHKKFDPETDLGKELKDWWQQLHGKGDYQGNPRTGERAELRRAKTVTDIILTPTFPKACFRFKPLFKDEQEWEYSIDRLAAILGLLAHISEEHSDPKVGMAFLMAGKPKPELSELRFRRLIQRDRDELYVAMIRVIRKLGKKGNNLHDLANSVYYWGDQIKRDWAFAYFPNTPEMKTA